MNRRNGIRKSLSTLKKVVIGSGKRKRLLTSIAFAGTVSLVDSDLVSSLANDCEGSQIVCVASTSPAVKKDEAKTAIQQNKALSKSSAILIPAGAGAAVYLTIKKSGEKEADCVVEKDSVDDDEQSEVVSLLVESAPDDKETLSINSTPQTHDEDIGDKKVVADIDQSMDVPVSTSLVEDEESHENPRPAESESQIEAVSSEHEEVSISSPQADAGPSNGESDVPTEVEPQIESLLSELEEETLDLSIIGNGEQQTEASKIIQDSEENTVQLEENIQVRETSDVETHDQESHQASDEEVATSSASQRDELAKKYAKLPLEEQAYQILVDLGMVEPS